MLRPASFGRAVLVQVLPGIKGLVPELLHTNPDRALFSVFVPSHTAAVSLQRVVFHRYVVNVEARHERPPTRAAYGGGHELVVNSYALCGQQPRNLGLVLCSVKHHVLIICQYKQNVRIFQGTGPYDTDDKNVE